MAAVVAVAAAAVLLVVIVFVNKNTLATENVNVAFSHRCFSGTKHKSKEVYSGGSTFLHMPSKKREK